MELFYKIKNGNWVRRSAIHEAFEIETGKTYYSDEKSFLCWLYPKLGKTIIAVKRSNDPTLIKELLSNGQKLSAIIVYKANHNCGLAEAKAAIDKMIN